MTKLDPATRRRSSSSSPSTAPARTSGGTSSWRPRHETNSRFTGFLSGIYLLGDSAKDAGAYTGPGHATGKASIGYGGPESEIVTEVNDLNLAYSKGHEIGTHYNGHFCDDNLPGGNQWNTADWNNELDQFFKFMTDWKTLNGYTDAPDLRCRSTRSRVAARRA